MRLRLQLVSFALGLGAMACANKQPVAQAPTPTASPASNGGRYLPKPGKIQPLPAEPQEIDRKQPTQSPEPVPETAFLAKPKPGKPETKYLSTLDKPLRAEPPAYQGPGFDLDHNGRIDAREAQTAFRELDHDHDGKLTPEEQLQLRARMVKTNRGLRVKQMDRDGDGKVSQQEREAARSPHDLDHDGKLSPEETKIWRKQWRKEIYDPAALQILGFKGK
ncbi:MAG: EF-hand domain-containing protein [Candidatus Eremiobacteraeota bacterium]|nr:EF-hand domain-containing protein [Candidatus Eremiobacteraeota bacterium]